MRSERGRFRVAREIRGRRVDKIDPTSGEHEVLIGEWVDLIAVGQKVRVHKWRVVRTRSQLLDQARKPWTDDARLVGRNRWHDQLRVGADQQLSASVGKVAQRP